MNIGKRLQAIADFIPPGARLADIGTDHAYLPAYLVIQGRIALAVAGDIHVGPFQSACTMIDHMGLADKIQVRLGNGFEIVKPGEADTAVIAGMGGATMIAILADRPDVVVELKRLVLQPMIGSGLVRQWLSEHGWTIVDELLVEEDEKLYEIIVAEPGFSPVLADVLAEVGPVLWQQKPPLLRKHLLQLIHQKERVLAEMDKSEAARHSAKYGDYVQKRTQLEEMVCQLPLA